MIPPGNASEIIFSFYVKVVVFKPLSKGWVPRFKPSCGFCPFSLFFLCPSSEKRQALRPIRRFSSMGGAKRPRL